MVDGWYIPIPHPVESHVVTVISGSYMPTSEQRKRLLAWGKANGLPVNRVSLTDPITVETRTTPYGSQAVIRFTQYYEEDGARFYDEAHDGAVRFERTAVQRVPLEPEPC